MGEYADYEGETVKIGTCESMYYLRCDQAHLVRPRDGNVDPIDDREGIRYRFPWPDEDRQPPGVIGDGTYDRKLAVPGIAIPEGVDHYEWSTPCVPETRVASIYEQAWRRGQLVLIAGCSCGALYNMERDDAMEFAAALRAGAQEPGVTVEGRLFLESVAERIVTGYEMEEAKWAEGALKARERQMAAEAS